MTVPANIEAEQTVVGALLVSEPAVNRVIETGLTADEFYLDRHRIIYRAMLGLHGSGRPVDHLTVETALTGAEVDPAYLFECSEKVSAPGNVVHHAEIVRQLARQREVLALGQKLIDAAQAGTVNGRVTELAGELTALTADGGQLRVRAADLSRVKPTRWLWQHRLPVGYVSLLVGAEGIGKSTLVAWLIAQITQGTLPGDGQGKPGRVLIVADEDGFDEVWVPRLYAAGADLDLVDVLEEDDDDLLDIGRDSGTLGRWVKRGDYRLLFIDALLDVLGRQVDDYKSKSVREAVRPLRRMARENEIAALGSLHPNKGRKVSFRDLVSGSHAFNAVSRSSLYLAEHPEDQDRRILVRPKGNLSVEPPGFEFHIDGHKTEINGYRFNLPVVAGEGEGSLGYQDVLTPATESPVTDPLTEEVDAIGTGQVQSRAEIARKLGREHNDRSIGRALEKLASESRWEKVGRGKWQKVASGNPLGSRHLPLSQEAEILQFPEPVK